MRKLIRKVNGALNMLRIPAWLADIGLAINRLRYKQLLESNYLRRTAVPSWFDHRIDLYYQWPHNLFWLERGFFARRHMFEGCTVLDLFCGDGFYAKHFYASLAGRIDAVDKDPRAIAHARAIHSHPKIAYWQKDAINEGLPVGSYDIVAWFEAIEHLSEQECSVLMKRIKEAVGEKGILLGSTPLVAEGQKGKSNWEHQHEFETAKEVEALLSHHFSEVRTEVTVYPELEAGTRRTAYFSARHPV
jgi:2-polyprenyl-3-methyl-5-hydroxy-6-metoxy-1,4-benzoquinol methylase